MTRDYVTYLDSIISDRFAGKKPVLVFAKIVVGGRFLIAEISDKFAVSPPKSFPGMAESTFLSRSFADQGVKLRIRKEPRTVM